MTNPKKSIELEQKLVSLFLKAGFSSKWGENKPVKLTNGDKIEVDAFAFDGEHLFLLSATAKKTDRKKHADNFISQCKKLEQDLKAIRNVVKQNFKKHVNPSQIKICVLCFNPKWTSKEIENLRKTSSYDNVFYWNEYLFIYFDDLSNKIRHYAKGDLYTFFNLEEIAVNDQKINFKCPALKVKETKNYTTYLLKSDPHTLMSLSLVLRKFTRLTPSYQRILQNKKLNRIKDFILINKDKLFPTNIIISLEYHKNIFSVRDKAYNFGFINLQKKYNSINIIDGQHRLFAFAKLKNNNLIYDAALIVTAIIFKKNIKNKLKLNIEAKTFVEINYYQTKIKNNLIYAIKSDVLNEKSGNALAYLLLIKLNEKGVFSDLINLIDLKMTKSEKLGDTSINRYCLSKLLEISGGTFYKIYIKINKEFDLEDYLKFVFNLINSYFNIIKNIFKEEWKDFDNIRFKIMSSVSIIGFILLLEELIQKEKIKLKSKNIKDIEKAMGSSYKIINKIKNKIQFSKDKWIYGTSKWAKLRDDMIKIAFQS